MNSKWIKSDKLYCFVDLGCLLIIKNVNDDWDGF